MTPAEHYKEAEKILAIVSERAVHPEDPIMVALAQAHATLATVDRTTALEAGNL